MKRWSIYRVVDGALTGRIFSSSIPNHLPNVSEGHAAIEGAYDHLSYRVDHESGKVFDYQPPSPGPDHEWNAERRRWVLTVEASQKQAQRHAAFARIRLLEEKQQRYQRTAILGDAEGFKRLTEIETEIASLRSTAFG